MLPQDSDLGCQIRVSGQMLPDSCPVSCCLGQEGSEPIVNTCGQAFGIWLYSTLSVSALVTPLFLLPAPLHPVRHPTWTLGPDGSSYTGRFLLSQTYSSSIGSIFLNFWTAGLWLLLVTFPQGPSLDAHCRTEALFSLTPVQRATRLSIRGH